MTEPARKTAPRAAPQCSDCKFWEPGEETGACHRHPPWLRDPGTHAAVISIWPPVSGSDWCGDFSAAEPA
jgi:hypothetical protein